MIRAVFLDIDNTLLSFSGYVRQTMRAGFQRFGLPPYEEAMFPVFERINNALWLRIERGELTFEELQKIRWDLIFRELGIAFDGLVFEAYFRDQLHVSAIPEPHARELLAYLSEKYILCAASNGPYEQQLNRLRLGGMYDCFRHFFISSRFGVQKPDAAFFDCCFRELREDGLDGLTPAQTVIIGDSMTSDMAGGIGYGMHTCLYCPDGRAPSAQGVEHIVTSLEQIREFL